MILVLYSTGESSSEDSQVSDVDDGEKPTHNTKNNTISKKKSKKNGQSFTAV